MLTRTDNAAAERDAVAHEPTIIDVARRAGVSKSLVSRVLNDAGSFSETSRAKVLDAAEELAYTHNLIARSLASGRSGVIGFLARRITTATYSRLLEELQATATDADQRIVCTTGHLDDPSELSALETLIRLRVDGLIIGSGALDPAAISRVAARVPVVVLGRNAPGSRADVVRYDVRDAASHLTQRLMDLRRRHVTLMTHPGNHSARHAERAMTTACRQAGIELTLIAGHYDYEPARRAFAAHLEGLSRLPEAVIGITPEATFASIDVLRSHGARVPEDTSVLALDAGRAMPFHADQLSGTSQRTDLIAGAAWTLLQSRIEDPDRAPRIRLIRGDTVQGDTAVAT